MSGEKDTYVNLRSSEYRRMMDTCQRVDNVSDNINRGMENVSQRLRREMSEQVNSINRRHDDFENALSHISGDMRQMESKFNRGLRNLSLEFQNDLMNLDNRLGHQIHQQGQELRSEIRQHRQEIDHHLQFQRQEYTQMFETVSDELADLRGDLSRFENTTNLRFDQQRQEYFHLIRNMGERFADALAEQRYALQTQINDINESLAEEKRDKHSRAGQWANDTLQLLNAIDKAYRHEKFQPGELEKLRSELVLTQSNIRNGDYEASISASQQTYLRAKTLQMVLEQSEMEWNAHLKAAKLSAAEVIVACDAQELAEFVLDTEDGSQKIKAEVDYWTEGKLSALKQQAVSEQAMLEKPDHLNMADFDKSLVKTQQMRQLVEMLSEQAKEALIASQLRNNIGQAIEASLLDAGWEIIDATYEGEDHRRSVHVKLRNFARDELVTIISPEQTSQQTIRNKINIAFFDRTTNDENNRLHQLKNITDMLKEDGLDCGTPTCVPGTENMPSSDVRKLDFESVREQQR